MLGPSGTSYLLVLLGSLFVVVPPVLAAINPNPELRVIPIGLLGIQEPASCLFSFVGGMIHLIQLLEYENVLKTNPSYPFKFLRGFFYLWIFTSFAAFFFHWHETKFNEKSDYYGVFLAIFYSLYAGILRLSRMKMSNPVAQLLALPFVAICLYVLWTMEYVLFDYGFHNKVCALGLVLHALVWCSVNITEPKARPYAKWIIFAHVTIFSCSVFELIDFIPIFQTFDGHSLWHLSACFVARMFHKFFVKDVQNFHAVGGKLM